VRRGAGEGRGGGGFGRRRRGAARSAASGADGRVVRCRLAQNLAEEADWLGLSTSRSAGVGLPNSWAHQSSQNQPSRFFSVHPNKPEINASEFKTFHLSIFQIKILHDHLHFNLSLSQY